MFRKILLIAAGSLVLASAPGAAQSAGDVRCLLLSNALTKDPNTAQVKQAGQMAAYFYLGKIAGRLNDTQLRATLAQQQKTMNRANAKAEAQACMQQVESSYKKLQAVGGQPAPKPK